MRFVMELSAKDFAKLRDDAKKQGKTKTAYVKSVLGLTPSVVGRPPAKKKSKRKE